MILPILYLQSGATSHLLCVVVKDRLRVQGSREPVSSYLFVYLDSFIFFLNSQFIKKKGVISSNKYS